MRWFEIITAGRRTMRMSGISFMVVVGLAIYLGETVSTIRQE